MAPNATQSPWVVVLAGGEGTRLGGLTSALYGAPRPKQFAVLAGDRSLLQATIERACSMVPLDRVLVVVSANHERIASEQLSAYEGVRLLVQPRNLDTGPGLLFPIAYLRAIDPASRVVFLPSDHHVANLAPLVAALAGSARGAARDRVTLIGVEPDQPEIEYGWIVRGELLGNVDGAPSYAVRAFREKPERAEAERLRATGGLWNTFISAGPLATYWQLAAANLPRTTMLLEAYGCCVGRHDERAALAAAYDVMPSSNFSRDVLAHGGDELAVVPVEGVGWCDWGSPRRVFDSLRGTTHLTALLARIASRGNIDAHELAHAN